MRIHFPSGFRFAGHSEEPLTPGSLLHGKIVRKHADACAGQHLSGDDKLHPDGKCILMGRNRIRLARWKKDRGRMYK